MRNIISFIRNIWVFRKALWGYRSWDHSGMFKMMEVMFNDMAKMHEEHGITVRAPKTARELRTVAMCAKRLHDDNYHDINPTFDVQLFPKIKASTQKGTLPGYSKEYHKMCEANQKNDLRLMTRLIERKSLSWWD